MNLVQSGSNSVEIMLQPWNPLDWAGEALELVAKHSGV